MFSCKIIYRVLFIEFYFIGEINIADSKTTNFNEKRLGHFHYS